MRRAEDVLDELVLATRPPRGSAIALTEVTAGGVLNDNWIAANGLMDDHANQRYLEKLAKLKRSDPLVDWSGIDTKFGERRRIAKYLSEVASAGSA